MIDKLRLRVVSQETELLNTMVDSVTLPGSEGELTLLPNHIPLMAKLDYGELVYRQAGQTASIAISTGFLNLGANNEVIVLVDSATHARDISLEKAREAIKRANETIHYSRDRQELLKAEASLKWALLQAKVAERGRGR